jgi:alanyl-tRNA synthetase
MTTTLKWPAARARAQFMDFFKERAHTYVHSSPVVPLGDPTLLFANAGMNQFKDIFIGTVDPNSEMGKLKRAVNSQTCIRAGGKHNDLEDVGRDTYHHTFFEMLGTWSFADYFKQEAIDWAWALLTEVYGLPKDQLYATYFEGSEELGVPADTECRNMWLKYLPDDHVLPGNAKDNLWEMGDVGPCGPCTELHFDRIGGRNAAHLVNHDDPMVLEIWNLVFMQYHRKEKGGKLTKLPAPHVDTGMGFERLVSVLQGVTSNYDTDIWTPLFAAIQKATGHKTPYHEETNQDAVIAYRVIADHIRCITMALSDGAVPDSVGRGFVLRRIIRRAIRYGTQFLGAQTGFFASLVPAVIDSLGDFFTHIRDENNVKRVTAIIKDEEDSFAKTWKTGLKHFETAKQAAIERKSTVIDPEDAFILHDRYGFPVDLTALLAEKEGMNVDLEAFAIVMQKNQVSGGRMAANKTFFDTYQVDELQRKGVPTTHDDAKYMWEDKTAKVLAVFNKDTGKFLDGTEEIPAGGVSVGVVVDSTNFYFECGGQVYDTGVIVFPSGRFDVERVHSFGGYIVHVGLVSQGKIAASEKDVKLQVNYNRRRPIAQNHTTTHQLNHCLRDVLQYRKPESFIEVAQRGSFVNEESLRFDFSYNNKLSAQEVADVEEAVNKVIRSDAKVYSGLVPLAKANEINSLRRNFEDKYPDPCMVISIGRPVEDLLANPASEEWKNYSIELCGGTHIKSMSEVERAIIISEDSLTKGVRRMVVYTGARARAAAEAAEKLSADMAATEASNELDFDEKQKALSVLAKVVNDSDIPLLTKWQLRDKADAAIKKVLADKKVAGAKAKEAAQTKGATLARQGPLTVATIADFGAEREPLQAVADAFLAAHPASGLFLIGVDQRKDKAMALVVLAKELTDRGLSAVEWTKDACGKGGGKPNAAQMGISAASVPEVSSKAQASVATMAARL